MDYKIQGYKPEKAFRYFEDLCAIPHGSGNEKGVSDYIVRFAKEHGLRYEQDAANNVIVYKDGSKGAEDKPPVILQGHIDMVNEKIGSSDHDFEKDGISVLVQDGWATADGTTLGADDGAGAALILTVLDDENQAHPPIEAVFTAGEEIGFVGASQLDFGKLSARQMINLDSEDEGIACVSCAGGMEYYFDKDITREEKSGTLLSLELNGLLGGHSGCDIDLDRVNALRMNARIVNRLLPFGAQVAEFSGGTADNAIPREASFSVLVPDENAEEAKETMLSLTDDITNEYKGSEPGISFTCTGEADISADVLTAADSKDLIGAILLAPDGVQRRDPAQDRFVITSLNLGIVSVTEDHIKFTFAPRSSVDSLQDATTDLLQLTADAFSFETSVSGRYPGWEYKEDSILRETFRQSYRELFGTELKVEGIHAGLECGLFAENLPGLDAISVGPTLRNVHTPEEAFDLKSNEKFYQLLSDVLIRLAE